MGDDMSEIKRSEIIYEEGWRDAAKAEKEPAAEQPEPQPDSKDSGPAPLLMIIQLAVCVTAALALTVLRAMDSDIYHGIMTAYRVEMNKPLISRELFESPFESIPTQADATVHKASADELSPE